MGKKRIGEALNWEDSKEYFLYIKFHSVLQFINIFNKNKERSDKYKWGDEVEALLVKVLPKEKKAKLLLTSDEVLCGIEKNRSSKSNSSDWPDFGPEFCSFQIETSPARPYGVSLDDLCEVETSMNRRTQIIQTSLSDDEIYLKFSNFPLGTKENLYPPSQDEDMSYGDVIPDRCMTNHPRYHTGYRNLMANRKGKMFLKVPLYQDKNTKQAIRAECAERSQKRLLYDVSEWKDEQWDPYTHIMGDCIMYASGSCSLQNTFQAQSFPEATYLYDQSVVLAPLVMALTASSIFFRNKLSDWDARYEILCMGNDDRSPYERDLTKDCEEHVIGYPNKVKPRRRWSTSPLFISKGKMCKDTYNDMDVQFEEDSYDMLIKAGIDDKMAKHIAFILSHKPIIVYPDTEQLDDNKHSDHFDYMNSTNWNSVRFKPPPLDNSDDLGWRVEYRTPELQLTDYENAAFSVFFSLLTMSICHYKLNLYMAISKVEKNMDTAHKRDAIKKERFFFRKDISTASDDDTLELMTMEEIMLGKGNSSRGLFSYIRDYLNELQGDNINTSSRKKIDGYLELVERRIRGELLTMSAWLRKFVREHPLYKQDSIISDEITYDLIVRCYEVANGKAKAPELLGVKTRNKRKRTPRATSKVQASEGTQRANSTVQMLRERYEAFGLLGH